MKIILLATTVVVGAVFLSADAADAYAQSSVEVTLSGRVDFDAGVMIDESADLTVSGGGEDDEVMTISPILDRQGDFENRVESFNVNVDAVAPNGLMYGAYFDVAAGSSGTSTWETNIYVAGAFGRLDVGDIDPAGRLLRITAPAAGTGGYDGVYGRYTPFSNAQNYRIDGESANLQDSIDAIDGVADGDEAAVFNFLLTEFGEQTFNPYTKSRRGSKRVYRTTGTALDDTGLTLGISYAPHIDDNDSSIRGRTIERSNSPAFQDVVSLAANYSAEFNDVSIGFAGSFDFGSASGEFMPGADAQNLSAYQLGAEVGFGGFSVGGQWVDNQDSGRARGFSDRMWTIGAGYSTGPWDFAVNYADKTVDGTWSGIVEFGPSMEEYSAGMDQQEQAISLMTTYQIAPGLSLHGDLVYFDYDDTRTFNIDDDEIRVNADSDGWVGVLSTRVRF